MVYSKLKKMSVKLVPKHTFGYSRHSRLSKSKQHFGEP